MRITQLCGYLLLNIAVSGSVAFAVLHYWENNRQSVESTTRDETAGGSSELSTNHLDGASTPPGSKLFSEPMIYRVRAGDSMGSIALRYEMTIEELMAANGLNDPNALAIDQLLNIPVRTAVQNTERPMATHVPVTPVITMQSPVAVVTSVVPPEISIRAVNGAGNLSAEQVVLVNVGGAVDLLGWVLVHPDGDVYHFPALRLHQTGQVTVHTGSGQDTVTDLFWGRDLPVWQSDHAVRLLDVDGNIHVTFELP